ncbi:methyl-accepting chemotaxis protein [Cohnella candidum]|uniref:Methyl-accepting chemotaxis protein n=1 Tax=Cohnella candidum TaxID=2674991 RepID=A0A3G3JTG6_9BACL|nr:methyl-accepting chemotaxis protein [Cohnella candidum]AYQ71523.1 methyl-accepting chemotaxis protein [Cohnella candidum]
MWTRAGRFKGNPLKSVGMKLFLVFFVSITAFVAVLGTASYQTSKKMLQNKVTDASLQTIVQTGSKLDLFFAQLNSLAKQISGDSEIADALLAYDKSEAGSDSSLDAVDAVQRKTSLILSDGDLIYAWGIYETDGTEITGSSTRGAATDAEWLKKTAEADGDAAWFQTAKEGYLNKGGNSAFAVGMLLKSASEGAKPKVLGIEFKMAKLEALMNDVNLGAGSQKYVVSADDHMVYTVNPEQLADPSPVRTGGGSDAKTLDAAVAGTDSLVVVSPIQSTGWYAVGTLPKKELYKETKSILNMTLLMVAAAIAVALGTGYAVVRMIGTPLRSLAQMMKQGANGDLSIRAKMRRSDEIGELADNFNAMIGNLSELVNRAKSSADQVRVTSQDLSEASRRTALAAKEIAVATEEIASGATSLSMEAERGIEVVERIGSQMRNMRAASDEMGRNAADVRAAGEQGAEYMKDLLDKTQVTEDLTRSMAENVRLLKESASSIRKILEVLESMTKQTNILSLNAAIEASRAGAAGKGFMVVADEIRKLADQSRQSIDVVGQITDRIHGEIDAVVGSLAAAYPVFEAQTASVKRADEIFARVGERMDGFADRVALVLEAVRELEATQGILSDAMGSVTAVAQQSSATTEQVASLSSEQSGIGEGLVGLSGKLDRLSAELHDSLGKFVSAEGGDNEGGLAS